MSLARPYIYYQVITNPNGNTLRLVCSWEIATKRQAKKMLKKLLTLWANQVKKPDGSTVNEDDVFPTVQKFINERILTLAEAKAFCLDYCSEFVFNTALTKGGQQ
tara:strand:+ start:261 stop:575 length:315 start_codon:yes stop_codon:yes gene_type:complete